MIRMLDRARWWLLLRWPAARSFVQGHRDGWAGMWAQDTGHYYMGGYRLGRAKLVDRSNRKA